MLPIFVYYSSIMAAQIKFGKILPFCGFCCAYLLQTSAIGTILPTQQVISSPDHQSVKRSWSLHPRHLDAKGLVAC